MSRQFPPSATRARTENMEKLKKLVLMIYKAAYAFWIACRSIQYACMHACMYACKNNSIYAAYIMHMQEHNIQKRTRSMRKFVHNPENTPAASSAGGSDEEIVLEEEEEEEGGCDDEVVEPDASTQAAPAVVADPPCAAISPGDGNKQQPTETDRRHAAEVAAMTSHPAFEGFMQAVRNGRVSNVWPSFGDSAFALFDVHRMLEAFKTWPKGEVATAVLAPAAATPAPCSAPASKQQPQQQNNEPGSQSSAPPKESSPNEVGKGQQSIGSQSSAPPKESSPNEVGKGQQSIAEEPSSNNTQSKSPEFAVDQAENHGSAFKAGSATPCMRTLGSTHSVPAVLAASWVRTEPCLLPRPCFQWAWRRRLKR